MGFPLPGLSLPFWRRLRWERISDIRGGQAVRMQSAWREALEAGARRATRERTGCTRWPRSSLAWGAVSRQPADPWGARPAATLREE